VWGYGFDGHRLVAVSTRQGRGSKPEEKGGPANPRSGELAGPGGPALAGYRVCSIRKAWAFMDWVLPVMPRRARAALASRALRTPRTGTMWSRYSVTAL
jgi:hypothetical protein